MIGLKRGIVELHSHKEEWREIAAETISKLKTIFGSVAMDIQHVGSTSIVHIKAKPIIDIAVAVNDLENVKQIIPLLETQDVFYRPGNGEPQEMLFVCGDFENDTRTHHIHVMESGSMNWINYLNFRDYLNATPSVAKEYEELKLQLMSKYSNDRVAYTAGKAEFIRYTLRKALVWSFLGKTVKVKIDRPIGSVHPRHSDMIYPINYGYIENVFGGDGEELDVYILGVTKSIETFTGQVIAIVHREDDDEDKIVAAPIGMKFSQDEIAESIQFQEKYYQSKIENLK